MGSEYKNLYPSAFLNWAGSKHGGVRNLFKQNSGRPAGQKIDTPLTIRLDGWIETLISSQGYSAPSAILLVGGPGNGKTDAVEECVRRFDKSIGANGALISRFSNQYKTGKFELPPRKSQVDFSDLYSFDSNLESIIQLVQDATEKDSTRESVSPEKLLNEELKAVLAGEYKGIYVSCVNRGILANASSLAHKENDQELIELINNLVKAASGGPNSPDCWPIKETPIAIWPMDADSLVAPLPDGSNTVMHHILKKALSDDLWKPPCSNSVDCPFCQNKLLLSDKATQDNLVQLLYFYELCAAKRWTFRDLYSLISYIFVGEQDELIIGKKLYEPCDWTAKQLEIIGREKEDLAFAKAPYLLMSKLYHHRLFSLWPKLTKGNHREAKRAAFKKPKKQEDHDGYINAINHFKALANLNKEDSSFVKKLLSESFSQYLDPALLSGDVAFYESKQNNEKLIVTANLIDERFGLSIDDGLKLVSRRIPEIERKLLRQLAKADGYLMEHNHSPLISSQVRFLQASIRQFSSRMVKRSLSVKSGLCKNVELLKAYSKLHEEKSQIRDMLGSVKKLINENKSFSVPLSTTFGQPVAHRERNISLLVSEIKPKMLKLYEGTAKPKEHLPYIEIHKDRYLPLTFNLFKAIQEVEHGLNEASLPEEIFAMLDEVKSIVAGEIVRHDDFLDSHVNIKIGSRELEIDVDELEFNGEVK